MNLAISGHNITVTPALREYLVGKLDRISRHFDQVIDVGVFLSVDNLVQKAKITLRVRGKDIAAEAGDEDLYAAIDLLIDKLDRQVLKYKTMRVGHDHEALKHQPNAS